MHESLRLLDAALGLTRQEDVALAAADEERLQSLCEQRSDLMAEAWKKRAGCDVALLRARLEAVQNAQNLLTYTAEQELGSLREALQSSREEGNRLSGYHKVVARQRSATLLYTRG